jgi:hypothetical protein
MSMLSDKSSKLESSSKSGLNAIEEIKREALLRLEQQKQEFY